MIDGTHVIAAFVAHIAFWVLLVIGVLSGAIRTKGAVVFLVLWAVGYAALPRLSSISAGFVTPWLAILDIALVLIISEGDVPIT
jgi:hypothetical protein